MDDKSNGMKEEILSDEASIVPGSYTKQDKSSHREQSTFEMQNESVEDDDWDKSISQKQDLRNGIATPRIPEKNKQTAGLIGAPPLQLNNSRVPEFK